MKDGNRWLGFVVSLLILPVVAPVQSRAGEQAWPTRPVRVIVPITAGSATDIITRIVSERLASQLGQNFVIDNRPGASGTIGISAAAKAEADGYTALVQSSSFTVVPITYSRLDYDTVRDFIGITPLGNVPNILVISPARGLRSVKELIAAARLKPGSITYALIFSPTAPLGTGRTGRGSYDLISPRDRGCSQETAAAVSVARSSSCASCALLVGVPSQPVCEMSKFTLSGPGIAHFHVAVSRAGGAHPERGVDVGARLGCAGLLQLLDHLIETLDLKTDVMDAAPARAALGACDDVVLEAQNGKIDVAVGEEVTGGARAVELSHLLQPEVLYVEPLGRLFILGLNRDMPDLCHGRVPSVVYDKPYRSRIWSAMVH